MILLILTTGMVGFVHSLSPGHWLPVVLLAKGRKWPLKKALFGALVAASGHIFISILFAGTAIFLGAHYLAQYEEIIERYSSLILIIFGLIFSTVAYKKHERCHGHTHHGPKPISNKPYWFLFSLGLSPCVAVLPLFIAVSGKGGLAIILTVISFVFGVLIALVGCTAVVTQGLLKVDHPLFEHHGDLITGVCITIMGVLLFFIK